METARVNVAECRDVTPASLRFDATAPCLGLERAGGAVGPAEQALHGVRLVDPDHRPDHGQQRRDRRQPLRQREDDHAERDGVAAMLRASVSIVMKFDATSRPSQKLKMKRSGRRPSRLRHPVAAAHAGRPRLASAGLPPSPIDGIDTTMQHASEWRPTKFAESEGRWTVTRNKDHLFPASRISAARALTAYAQAIPTYARGHLADMGCGQVPLFGLYRDFVDQVTCIDWPGSSRQLSHVDIFADLNAPLEIDDRTFDTIISTSVIEHIWRHDVLWSEMARTMRPGGHIIMGAPFVYQLHEEPHDYFRWTRHALERSCETNGLEVIELRPYGGGLDVLADLFAKLAARKRPRLGSLLATFSMRMLRSGPLRRFSDNTADKIPLGYLLVARKP
jgi:SAM-dependent methyltransferase